MKTKTKIKLIAILIAVLACTLIAGCQVGRETYGQFVERNGLSCHITYYSNGGLFETRQNKKEVYYSPDTCAINIGVSDIGTSNIAVHRDGYVLKEWCEAELDSQGNIVYEDDEKTIVKAGKPFDFSRKLKSGEEISLYATWTLDVLIEFRLAGDNSIAVKDGEGTKTVNVGDVLAYRTFGKETSVFVRDEAPEGVESTDSTFVQYFEDEDCTIPFDGTAIKPVTPEGEDVKNLVLYAKFIPGQWTVVKDRMQVSRMFSRMAVGSYYIYNDIDCGGMELNVTSTNCKIEGNGHVTLSNLSINQTGVSSNAKFSMFGTVGANASIKNVTFDNVTISYSTRSGLNTVAFVDGLYVACSDIVEGASFENVKITNVEMNVSIPKDDSGEDMVIIENLRKTDGAYATDNWLFGGMETDAAFIAKYDGISIEKCTLSIDGEPTASVD